MHLNADAVGSNPFDWTQFEQLSWVHPMRLTSIQLNPTDFRRRLKSADWIGATFPIHLTPIHFQSILFSPVPFHLSGSAQSDPIHLTWIHFQSVRFHSLRLTGFAQACLVQCQPIGMWLDWNGFGLAQYSVTPVQSNPVLGNGFNPIHLNQSPSIQFNSIPSNAIRFNRHTLRRTE